MSKNDLVGQGFLALSSVLSVGQFVSWTANSFSKVRDTAPTQIQQGDVSGFGGPEGGPGGAAGEWTVGPQITKQELKKQREIVFDKYDKNGNGYLEHFSIM